MQWNYTKLKGRMKWNYILLRKVGSEFNPLMPLVFFIVNVCDTCAI
jgi:hypothetical protein